MRIPICVGVKTLYAKIFFRKSYMGRDSKNCPVQIFHINLKYQNIITQLLLLRSFEKFTFFDITIFQNKTLYEEWSKLLSISCLGE